MFGGEAGLTTAKNHHPQSQNVCRGELDGGELGKAMSEGEESDGGGSPGLPPMRKFDKKPVPAAM